MLELGRAADLGPVAVACGDAGDRRRPCAPPAAVAVLTDPNLPSGSDRVHAALGTLDPGGAHDVVVNLQGDFPTLPASSLRAAVAPLDDPEVDIGTLVVPFLSDAEAATEFVREDRLPVCGGGDDRARAVFFAPGDPLGPGPRWHHIGIYAYRRAALARFVALPPSPLEQRESLEQLRALEAGMRIGCARVAHGPFGVDTQDDLERARRLLGPGGGAP